MTRQAVGETSMPIHWRLEVLGGDQGGAAAAKGVQDDVALVAASFDDAFKEGDGFLGRIAEGFVAEN